MARFLQLGFFASAALVAWAASPEPPPNLPTPESHLLKLRSLTLPPIPGPAGLLVAARLNGGPVLRLLLDSGAQFPVFDKRTAGRSGLRGSAELDLVGAGIATPKAAATAKASTIEAGGVILRDLDVVIVNDRVLDGVDGVLPLAVFRDYLIRLDVSAKSLELTPYPAEASAGHPAIVSRGLLFVKGVLNSRHEGYFLLDTGASTNAISTKMARRMNSSTALEAPLTAQGGIGRFDATVVNEVRRLQVGPNDLFTGSVVAVDLSLTSRYYNFEVSGLLGYPALRNTVVTVNYRDQWVRFDPK